MSIICEQARRALNLVLRLELELISVDPPSATAISAVKRQAPTTIGEPTRLYIPTLDHGESRRSDG